ncbi:uncharacterized protein LOC103718148 [Phoenix dactylifera]|uniref:Uncharacterized protein LOC103718148 n=1 Tax=Phoenix dactylifera TaxID=42345 RepID=A0A8B7CSI8_PHODC|nr:uncharacterized protein LOC103718148 [Phoenix dactylifera]XP_008805051.2 uncharacterized protein LOC103718148 [Phoenix dactylifera]XP_038972423.1 uncharacterized protein LOC103718148 [Phoenix dactylifera]
MAEEEEQQGLGPFKEEEEKEKGHGEKAEGLTPWEQHSAVISLPRYDYTAPSSLLERSHSGFLITCPIKREKSATKEAISLLEKYVGYTCSKGCESLQPCDANVPAKKRKICSSEICPRNGEDAERNGDINILEVSGKLEEEARLGSSETTENVKDRPDLSLVKLTGSGLLLFTFPSNSFRHVVDILSDMFLSLRSGKLKPPLWCHRIFPIQETCLLTEKNLKVVISKLVQEYLSNKQDRLDGLFKFAAGYNRRGIDETEMKVQKNTLEDSEGLILLDRDTCFKVVAGAVKAVAKNAVVDLKSPEVAVLVELLPLSGVPHGTLVVGVSVLPVVLVTTKPRLCVKSLVADTNVAKKRG